MPAQLEEKFQKAADLIKTTLELDLSNNQKLRLYALFKQATSGRASSKGKPSAFSLDFVAKAKWEAWNKLGDMSSEQAKKDYIDFVTSVVPAEPTTNGGGESSVSTALLEEARRTGVGLVPSNPADRQCFLCGRSTTRPNGRIIAFPNFASTGQVFRGWAHKMEDDLEFWALEPPAMSIFRHIEPYEDAEIMANCLWASLSDSRLPLLDRPFSFYGQCIQGSFAAMFMTHWLARKNIRPQRIFIGAAVPPHLPIPDLADPSTLIQVFQLPKSIMERNPLMHKLATNLFPTFLQLKDYPKVTVPITLFRGTCDPFVTMDHCKQWQKYTTESVTVVEVPGAEHIFQHKEEFSLPCIQEINRMCSIMHREKECINRLSQALGFHTPSHPGDVCDELYGC